MTNDDDDDRCIVCGDLADFDGPDGGPLCCACYDDEVAGDGGE